MVLQNFLSYMDDVAESKKMMMNCNKERTTLILCVLQDLSASHYIYITLHCLRIGRFPKGSTSCLISFHADCA